MLGAGWTTTVATQDTFAERIRHPPARPIPVEFPECIPPLNIHTLTQTHAKALRQAISQLRRPNELSADQLSELNIDLNQNIPLAELVPSNQFHQRPFLYDDELTAMLTELSYDNEDAFRELLRKPPLEGRKKPRLAYSRNFFTNLEDLRRYYDTSEDRYFEVPADQAPKGVNPEPMLGKDKKFTNDGSNDVKMSGTDNMANPTSTTSLGRSDERSLNDDDMRPVYTGQRIGNSEQVPPGVRAAVARNYLKMALHKFGCRDADPNLRDCLVLQNVRLPMAQYSVVVNKVPADMKLARARMSEGPVLAMQVRHEARFKSRTGSLSAPGSDVVVVGEEFDLFREVGSLLLLASQRAREGKTAGKVSAKNWWATKPRWGGGPTKWGQLACELYEDEDPSWSDEERKLQMQRREREAQNEVNVNDVVSSPQSVGRNTISTTTLPVPPTDALTSITLPMAKPASPPLATSVMIPLPPSSPGGDVKMTGIDINDLLAGSERPKKKPRSGTTLRDNSTSNTRSPTTSNPSINMTPSPLEIKDEFRNGRKLIRISTMKKKWFQEWTVVRPNTPTWNDKMIYKAIGKDTTTTASRGWDDVFLLSVVNHHISIVKMSVHEKYLNWVATGEDVKPTGDNTEKREDVLYVSRSPWYDLFKIDQRTELLIGLWRIMCWINRESVPKAEYEKIETKKA